MSPRWRANLGNGRATAACARCAQAPAVHPARNPRVASGRGPRGAVPPVLPGVAGLFVVSPGRGRGRSLEHQAIAARLAAASARPGIGRPSPRSAGAQPARPAAPPPRLPGERDERASGGEREAERRERGAVRAGEGRTLHAHAHAHALEQADEPEVTDRPQREHGPRAARCPRSASSAGWGRGGTRPARSQHAAKGYTHSLRCCTAAYHSSGRTSPRPDAPGLWPAPWCS